MNTEEELQKAAADGVAAERRRVALAAELECVAVL